MSKTDETGSVIERIAALRRQSGGDRIEAGERAARALAAAGPVWARRLAEGWTPPDGGSFPWPMVCVSLEGLVPGLRDADAWRLRGLQNALRGGTPPVVALILAGNTPLMSWSPLAACLLAGAPVFVKMSRDETLWPRLFRDVLAAVDPEVAASIELDVWPGEDPRTAELIAATDAVIAYGSDATLDALRAAVPVTTPFFGFGHAISVGLVPAGQSAQALGFARDALLYGQQGCLSLQALYVEGQDGSCAEAVGAALATALIGTTARLKIEPVSVPGSARAVRLERDMALFRGATVRGDDDLRWTVATYRVPEPLNTASSVGVISVIPIANAGRDLGPLLGPARRRVSCVAVAGEVSDELRTALTAEGVSRICKPGEMQAPPLDWPNGGRDLLAELLWVMPRRVTRAGLP